MKRNVLVQILLLLILTLPSLFVFSETLTVLHAGSLTVPLRKAEKAFAKQYKNVSFNDESAGSVKIMRMITEIGKEADIVAVADYSLIPQYLIPEFADWYIEFATNQLVIAYTPASKYAKEINQKNWYEILLKNNVEFGYSNPNLDPCGYRTRLMFELAEKYYNIPGLSQKLTMSCSPNNVKSKSVALIAGLESGELDYAFEYLSVAKQNGLKYILLPPQLNFGSQKYANFYSQATIVLSGEKKVIGKPIVYGVTIPKNAPHKELAEKFLAFVLSPQGREIFEDCGQPPIVPQSNLSFERLPKEVARVIEEYVKK
jgi:molybdate/tungstate transport system substrate-binding protein